MISVCTPSFGLSSYDYFVSELDDRVSDVTSIVDNAETFGSGYSDDDNLYVSFDGYQDGKSGFQCYQINLNSPGGEIGQMMFTP